MADVCDQAFEQNQVAFEAEQRARRMPEGPAPTGRCLNCDEEVPEGRRWCDAECMTDYQHRQAALRRLGRSELND